MSGSPEKDFALDREESVSPFSTPAASFAPLPLPGASPSETSSTPSDSLTPFFNATPSSAVPFNASFSPQEIIDFNTQAEVKAVTDFHGFASSAQALIKKLLMHFSVGLLSSEDFTPFRDPCVSLMQLFVKLSYELDSKDPHYSFFHDNKTRLTTLCTYAFGIDSLTPAGGAGSTTPDLSMLASYLEPYIYSLEIHTKTSPGEIDLSYLESLFNSSDATFKFQSCQKFFCANPALLWNAAYNLCTNAIKYGKYPDRKDEKIEISFLIIHGDRSSLIISNTGRPISPEAINTLNKTFTEGAQSPVNLSIRSSGKGLSALFHAGAVIECLGKNAEDQGASMKIDIPGYRPLLESEAVSLASEPLPIIKIIIVDDERSNQRILDRQIKKLEAEGFIFEKALLLSSYDPCDELAKFLTYSGPKLLIADQNISGKTSGSSYVDSIPNKSNLAIVFVTSDPIPGYTPVEKSKVCQGAITALTLLGITAGIIEKTPVSSRPTSTVMRDSASTPAKSIMTPEGTTPITAK